MNETIFRFLFGLSHRNIFLDSVGAFLGHYFPYFLVLALLPFVFRYSDTRKRIFFVAETGLALILARGIVTNLIRFFYYHPRPPEALGIEALINEAGASFPSGHAAFFFALATTLFLWNRTWGGVYFGGAFIISLARVFAGVHWPLDIAGGIIVGVFSALLIHFILREYREGVFRKKEEEQEEAQVSQIENRPI